MKRFFTLLVFSLLFFGSSSSKGIRGGDIRVTWLDSFRYEITATLLFDCDSSEYYIPDIKVNTPSGIVDADTQWLFSVKDITPLGNNCPDTNKCGGGSFPYGFTEYRYKAIFNLNSKNYCEVKFFIQQCCRPASITTGPAGQPFYLETVFNTCVFSRGTHEFTDGGPLLIRCHNQDVVYAMGFSLPCHQDDSISYHLVSPMQNSGSMVTYNPPYSPFRPIHFLGFPNYNLSLPGGFRLDPLTGVIFFRPIAKNQEGVIAVEAAVWMEINGMKSIVHRVRREVTILIVACPGNKAPSLPGSPLIQACAGEKNCITINSSDDDLADSVKLEFSGCVPGMYYTPNPLSRLASGTVCWTPDSTQVSPIPYTFTMTATDNACPMPGYTSRAYSFFVREKAVIKTNVSEISCGSVKVDATLAKPYSNLNTEWRVMDSSRQLLHKSYFLKDTFKLYPGKYYFEFYAVTPIPCVTYSLDSVTIQPYGEVDIPSETIACQGDNISVTATTSTQAQYFDWHFLKNGKESTVRTNQATINIKADSSLLIWVNAFSNSNCYATDTGRLTVRLFEKPPANVTLCHGDSILIGVTNRNEISYAWNTGDTVSKIRVGLAGHYMLTSRWLTCAQTDTIRVRNGQRPVIILPADTYACESGEVLLTPMVKGMAPLKYAWSNGAVSKNLLARVGPYTIFVTDSAGCIDTARIIVRGIRKPIATDSISACVGDEVEVFSPATRWLIDSVVWDNAQVGIKYKATHQRQSMIIATIKNIDGCIFRDSLYGQVYEGPQLLIQADIRSASDVQFSTLPALPSWTYHWDFGDGTFSNLAAPYKTYQNGGNYKVLLQTTDSVCNSRDSITVLLNVGVKTSPDASDVSAYPNPFYGRIYVKIPHGQESMEAKLFDMQGKQVLSATLMVPANGVAELITGELPPGNYLLKVVVNGTEVSIPLVH